MKKNTKVETENKTENKLEMAIANGVTLSRTEGAFSQGVVAFFALLCGLTPLEIVSYAVHFVLRLNAEIRDIGIRDVSALKDNRWDTRQVPCKTRTVYTLYTLARRLAENGLRYICKGITEEWHIRDLIPAILTLKPADFPKDAKLPMVAQALQRLNAVLHTAKAQVECLEKDWNTAEKVFRGLDTPRLRKVIYFGEYSVPVADTTGKTWQGVLDIWLAFVNRYLVGKEDPRYAVFELFGGYLIWGGIDEIADNVRAVCKNARVEKLDATDATTVALTAAQRLAAENEEHAARENAGKKRVVKRVKTLAETDAIADMLETEKE
jgi:hypothetical protein